MLNGARHAFLLKPNDVAFPVDVALEHTHEPLFPRVNRPITFVTTVANNGAEIARINVEFAIASALNVALAPDSCVLNDMFLECDLGEMAAGKAV